MMQERKLSEKPKAAKLLQKLKLMLVQYHKKVRWFFSYVRNSQLVVFWGLSCGTTCKWVLFANKDVFFYWLAQIIGTNRIDLLTRAQSRLRREFNVCVPLRKRRHCLRFSSFLIFSFIYMRHNLSFNPACKTTGVQDACRTLTAIPFKVGVNNSSKIFAIVCMREKAFRVSVPV